jgi:HEPN domain-containing protein
MPDLSPDWQLNIAYNAALQAATAALAASGYRAAREAHHYRVIQSLAFTLKADPRLIAQLDKFRKKRNIGSYEQAGAVSEREAKEMFALARNLREEVEKWLRSNHPKLL